VSHRYLANWSILRLKCSNLFKALITLPDNSLGGSDQLVMFNFELGLPWMWGRKISPLSTEFVQLLRDEILL
jgi:hypothetical protein